MIATIPSRARKQAVTRFLHTRLAFAAYVVLLTTSLAAADDVKDYVLGAQDKLIVTVVGLDENDSQALRIDPAGDIDVPRAGPIHAAGLTVSELRTRITEKFTKYVRNPQVTVTVSEYRSQSVTVVGEVRTPGVQQFSGPARLLQAIALGGGLSKKAGSTITITREPEQGPLPLPGARTDLGSGCSIAKVEIAPLTASKDSAANILLRSNDVLSVSSADLVYVVGEVNQPGGFAIDSRQKVTAIDALSMAGGALATGVTKKAFVVRVTGEGKTRQEIPTDLARILNGKAPDVPLQPNDILVIPNNSLRGAQLGLTNALTQVAVVEIYRQTK